jgi:hypothetical protein
LFDRVRAGPHVAGWLQQHINREGQMKKIKDAKKLQLNTETIVTLTPDEEAAVAGGLTAQGAAASTLQTSCNVICTDPVCCPVRWG